MFELKHGDCLDVLGTMADNSIDAIVTDPPYGLSFMGKRWDYDVPDEAVWRECLRVLKPGGHLLAFAGTRTQHRMAVRIEDAGFEIRDMIAWVYGSGFPKSLDVSKAIDRQRHDTEQVLKVTTWLCSAVKQSGKTHAHILQAFGFNQGSGTVGHWTATTQGSQPAVPTLDQIPKLLDVLGLRLDDVPDDIRELIWTLNGNKGQPGAAWFEREVVGQGKGAISTRKDLLNDKGTVWGANSSEFTITAPATAAAKEWAGWGTALKPALEPITVARKPIVGTVANNVLTWGTGGINVDGCRVGTEGGGTHCTNRDQNGDCKGHPTANGSLGGGVMRHARSGETSSGRFPANLIHDGSEEAVLGMGESSRYFYCAKASKRDRDEGCEGFEARNNMRVNGPRESEDAKHATLRANHHPTVKPTDLMRYLCRLVTPPNGTVLDPFMGSGSTGKAAILEGFRFIGIEREAEYLEIARARIDHVTKEPNLWQS